MKMNEFFCFKIYTAYKLEFCITTKFDSNLNIRSPKKSKVLFTVVHFKNYVINILILLKKKLNEI